MVDDVEVEVVVVGSTEGCCSMLIVKVFVVVAVGVMDRETA